MAKEGKFDSRKVLFVAVVAVINISLLVAVIVLAVEKNNLEKESQQPASAIERKKLDLLSHFGLKDGLGLKWFPAVKTRVDINMARSGKNHILDVKVVFGSSGTPKIKGGNLSLRQFLDAIHDDDFAVNFDLASDDIADAVLNELRSRKFAKPVLLSVPVISQQSSGVNLERFLETVENSDMAALLGVNLELTSPCCDEAIGFGLVEFVALISVRAEHLVTVEVDALDLVRSWTQLKSLLYRVDDLKLVISANNAWNTTIKYDLMLARNNADVRRIFYNIGMTNRGEFATLASMAGSLMIYFGIEPRDAGKIIWSHNTDTWKQLNEATAGS